MSSSIGVNESKSNTCVFSARVELIHNHRQKDTEILRDAHQQGLRDSGTDTNQNRPFTVLFAWLFPATKSNHYMTSSAAASRQMLFSTRNTCKKNTDRLSTRQSDYEINSKRGSNIYCVTNLWMRRGGRGFTVLRYIWMKNSSPREGLDIKNIVSSSGGNLGVPCSCLL